MRQEKNFYKKVADLLTTGESAFASCELETYIKCLLPKETSDTANVIRYEQPPRVVIFGGGHISLALSEVFDFLDYKLTIIDDREEFANDNRFPKADKVICSDYVEAIHNNLFGNNAYYIIVTRGHEHDFTCLSHIIDRESSYIGMIGSKTKIQITMDKLKARGVSEEKRSRVYAPIGINIEAKSPQEIAISIAAEVISVMRRNNKKSIFLDKEIMEILIKEKSGVLVSVVEAKGSAPGKKGSFLFVDDKQNVYGTIGGGNVENVAINEAKNIGIDNRRVIRNYNLANDESGKLGMTCGGEVKVLFEYLEGNK